MTKIYLISDVHIGTYSNYNFHSNFRKEIFINSAKMLVERGKQNNVNKLGILGDFVVVPNPSQSDLNTLYEFISILKEQFEIYYILGNHDTALRENLDETNSITRLFHLNYMNNKVVEWDNVKVGFVDYSWGDSLIIPDCDVVLGHYTLPLIKGLQSQKIENKSAKLGIFGDIHTIVETTISGMKCISCNCFLQNNFGDNRNPSFVELTLDNGNYSYKRILTESETFKPLKLLYSYEIDDSNINYEPKYVVSKFHNKEIEEKEQQQINEIKNISSFENIDKYIEDKEVVQLIHDNLDLTSTYEIDLDFKLIDIEIHNFKSINDYTFSFDNGLTLLYGLNGSGKSLIIQALYSVFQNKKYLKQFTRTETDDCYVSLRFIYKNKEYIIKNGNKREIVIDGNKLELKQRELEDFIQSEFSFVSYIPILFRNNAQTFFSYDNRYPILCLLFRIDIIQSYIDTLNSIISNFNQEIKDLNKEKSNNVAVMNSIEVDRKYIDIDKKEEIDTKEIENKIKQQEQFNILLEMYQKKLNKLLEEKKNINEDELQLKLNKRKELGEEYKKTENNIREYNFQIKELNQEINNLKSSMIDKVCKTCGTVLENISDEIKEKINNQIIEKENNKKEIISLRDNLQGHLVDLDNQIEEINERKILEDLSINDKIKDVEKEISSLVNPNFDIEVLTSSLNIIKEQNKKIIEENLLIETNKKNLEKLLQYSDKTVKLDEKIKEKNSKLEKCNTVLSLLDFQTNGSLTNQLLKEITASMSTDKIKYKVEDGSIEVYFNVGNKWIHYDSLSEGQKLMVDLTTINYISKSVNIGIISIDESLSLLDEVNILSAIQLLKESNINTIIIAGQTVIISSLVDKIIEVSLLRNGISNYKKLY